MDISQNLKTVLDNISIDINVINDKVETKQAEITSENKLDYSLISGAPAGGEAVWGSISGTLSNQTDLQNALNDKANASDIPLSTSQLTNDSGFITDSSLQGLASETYVDNAVSSKIDNPSGGTVGQVLTKTADGEEWADSQGGGGGDAKNVTIENKTKSGNTFVVDFLNGKQIQKYNIANAASESLQISIADNFSSLPSGVAPTVELQIPVVNDVSSVILPNNVQIIEMPEILSGAGGVENTYKYHDIVFRAEKDCNDIWKTYANYAYAFNEVYYPSGMPTLGLTYWMPFDSSYETPTIGNNNLTLEGTAPTLETQDGISGMTSDSGTGYLYEQGTATYWTPETSGVPNATFSMWFKPTSWSGDILFCAGENYHSWSSENSAANLLIVANNNEMRFIVHDTTDHIHVNTYPELDKWHHYAIVFDHSLNKMSIYVDGVLAGDDTTSTDHHMLNVNTISFYKELGSQTLGAPAIGNITGLRIYDRVLDATEIATLATEFTPTV